MSPITTCTSVALYFSLLLQRSFWQHITEESISEMQRFRVEVRFKVKVKVKDLKKVKTILRVITHVNHTL
jgi:hypothetical protein